MFRIALVIILLCSSLLSYAAEDKTLYIYNWAEYFTPDTLKNFTKETGVKVVYDVFDSQETVETKLILGHSGYDVVFVVNSPFFKRQLDAGLFQPLEKSKLPHLPQIQERFLKDNYKDNKLYGAPYMWGTMGIGYDAAKVRHRLPQDAPYQSWALFLDPANLQKVQGCGVAVMDAPNLIFPIVLKYLGMDPQSTNIADYQKATQFLMKIRPYITYFHNSQYLNDMANGSVCFAVGWSGDLTMARKRANESKNGVHVEFVIPKEGSIFAYDVMTIPKDAKHPEYALQFIDYLMRPEVLGAITNHVTYPNANPNADKFMDPALRSDPAIYPPTSVVDEMFVVPRLSPKLDREMSKLWARFKSGINT